MLAWPLLAMVLTAQDPARAADAKVLITLRRTTCYGDCPDYTVRIDGDGTVTYEGRQSVRVTGKQTARIDRAAVRKLVAEFEQIDFFSLQDQYSSPVTDLPTTYVSLTLGTRSKAIKDYYGAPKSLRILERHIDEQAGVERWIHIDAATVRQMVRAGWQASGEEGASFLLSALRHDDVEVVAALVDAGVDVNGANPIPLMMVRSGAAARLLIAAGANAQTSNARGITPLWMSIFKEPELTKVLLQAGAVADEASERPPLCLAACIGNAEAVDALLKAGAAPDRADSTGKTPRQCAESAAREPDSPPVDAAQEPPFVKDFARVLALLDQAIASKRK